MPLTNGSGSGSRRPKNRWIRIRIQIRIRNTGCKPSVRQRNNCTYISMLHSEMVIPSSSPYILDRLPRLFPAFIQYHTDIYIIQVPVSFLSKCLTDDGINFVRKKDFVQGTYVLLSAMWQICICFNADPDPAFCGCGLG